MPTRCLTPAIRIQRDGLPAAEVKARLEAVPEVCEYPDDCRYSAIGCREVNARYLRDVYRIAGKRNAA